MDADPAGEPPPAPSDGPRGPEPTPPYGMPPIVHVDDPVTGEDVVEPDLATLNARLGLLASLSGFAFALPAVAILKLAGSPAVLWTCAVVFVAGVVAGLRLPVRRATRAARAVAACRRTGRGARTRWRGRPTSTTGGSRSSGTWPPSGPSPGRR